MDSVQIDLTNGKRITFDCESINMEVVQAFLADHGDDSTLAIHGFDNVTGEILRAVHTSPMMAIR
jgi:hypothetical protein